MLCSEYCRQREQRKQVQKRLIENFRYIGSTYINWMLSWVQLCDLSLGTSLGGKGSFRRCPLLALPPCFFLDETKFISYLGGGNLTFVCFNNVWITSLVCVCMNVAIVEEIQVKYVQNGGLHLLFQCVSKLKVLRRSNSMTKPPAYIVVLISYL